ncbi:PBSX family phage terminase large subunit [Cryobacterium sp. 10S3]|uniref:PBSX family phage terminase large subunit n=1 Tax=Cryobacterium sp. 10S3 TaxID=3048582 RepID=UPI002AC94463|nr:PBSX family phage terminase large subunit [Cryobacterium sp. 10S3]MEB0287219.1 PBSX family phage terminase large subunit [Cryobacterium sp. 10S3]WPX14174.1 PBSX family phage terminase large subunit [Cryobacterium sp. 10S3]
MDQRPTVKIQFLNEFRELFNESWRNIVFYGGRGSGKTRHIGLALVLRGRTKRLRILATREIQNTLADSVHKVLKDIIEQYGFTDYEVTDKTIRNRITGTEFLFAGLRHNVNEIKSMEGIDIAWVEEAQSISEDSLKVLAPTIRKTGSQLIFSYNRLNELDPVHVRYVIKNPAKTYARKVNFDVLERAGLLPEALKLERDEDAKDPALYAHVWLGEPVSQEDTAIIGRLAILEAMKRKVDDDGAIEIGADIARMGNDRTVFKKRKGLRLIETRSYTKLRTTEVCDKLEAFAGYDKKTLIKVDDTGVGGGVTDEMMKRGYNVLAINFGAKPMDSDKYPNLISEAWFYMATIMPTIQLDMKDDVLMELSNRHWKMDTKGRRGVESKDDYKKRGFRSPDEADATILCFYTPHSTSEFRLRII